jgi:hypothetical protein
MTRKVTFLAAVLALSWIGAACAVNGGAGAGETPTPDVLGSAAAQATALVQQAQATAMVLEAQAQATALVEQAWLAGGTPTSAVENRLVYLSPTPLPAADSTPVAQQDGPVAPAEAEVIPVQITSIGFAADTGMIMVRFLAPPEETEKWWPGTVSVTDEGSGAVYSEIPVLPKVGPLIGRPKQMGQPGYVMLINVPPYLRSGALVTVVLGAHRFEHVPVQ